MTAVLARAGGPIARLLSARSDEAYAMRRGEAAHPSFPNLVSQAVMCGTAPFSTAGLMVRGSGARRGVDIARPSPRCAGPPSLPSGEGVSG